MHLLPAVTTALILAARATADWDLYTSPDLTCPKDQKVHKAPLYQCFCQDHHGTTTIIDATNTVCKGYLQTYGAAGVQIQSDSTVPNQNHCLFNPEKVPHQIKTYFDARCSHVSDGATEGMCNDYGPVYFCGS